MEKYYYLVKKIEKAQFVSHPFKHIFIENFLSEEHFNLLINQININIPKQKNTKELIDYLQKNGYLNIEFPGCITDISNYISDIEKNKNLHVGLAFKLQSYLNHEVKELLCFLNSRFFQICLKSKFQIKRSTKIGTNIQKYLNGYQISPHPDTREKALTYLININTTKKSEEIDIHTHLFKFKPEYEYVKRFWESNEEVNRCWLPWEWCTSEKTIYQNNSLIMFAPNNDTLHGVKLNYDHLDFQRTQIHGSLTYNRPSKFINVSHNDITK